MAEIGGPVYVRRTCGLNKKFTGRTRLRTDLMPSLWTVSSVDSRFETSSYWMRL